MYLSTVVQNELIGVCGKLIQADMAKRLNKSLCYSMLVDEKSDIKNTEQLSICAQYVSNRALREDFRGFAPVSGLTGQGLTTKILETLKNHCFNLSKLAGQGYDGLFQLLHQKGPSLPCDGLRHGCEIQPVKNV
jgi:hypothetical protein